MSDLRQIARNAGFLALARFAERISGLVVTVLISRSLGVASLGIYSSVIAYYALLSPAGELGVVNLLVREIARARERTNAYLIHAAAITAGASAIAIAIFLIVLPYLGLTHELTFALTIVAFALIPGTLNAVQESVFIAHQRVSLQTRVTGVSAVVNALGGILLLETGHGVVALFVLFVAIQYAVTIVYFVLISRKIARIRWDWDRRFARAFLHDVRPFAGNSVVAALFSRPEIIALSLAGGAADVGYYSAALRIASLWNDVTQVLMANVFPVMSRLHATAKERFDAVRTNVLRSMFAISLPIAVGAFVVAEPLMKAVYGSHFGPATMPMRILCLIIPLGSVQAVLWRDLSARTKQGVVLRAQLVSVVARLALVYPLIRVAGTSGAAVCATVAIVLNTLLLWVNVERHGSRVHLVRIARPFAAASLGMGLVSWVLLRHVDVWATVASGVLVYAVLVLPVALRAVESAGGSQRITRVLRPNHR